MAIPMTPNRTLAIMAVKTITLPDSFLPYRCRARSFRICLLRQLLHQGRRICRHRNGAAMTVVYVRVAADHHQLVDDGHRPVTAAAAPTAPIKCPGLEIDCACHGKSAATAARICHTRRRSAVICLESTQAD